MDIIDFMVDKIKQDLVKNRGCDLLRGKLHNWDSSDSAFLRTIERGTQELYSKFETCEAIYNELSQRANFHNKQNDIFMYKVKNSIAEIEKEQGFALEMDTMHKIISILQGMFTIDIEHYTQCIRNVNILHPIVIKDIEILKYIIKQANITLFHDLNDDNGFDDLALFTVVKINICDYQNNEDSDDFNWFLRGNFAIINKKTNEIVYKAIASDYLSDIIIPCGISTIIHEGNVDVLEKNKDIVHGTYKSYIIDAIY